MKHRFAFFTLLLGTLCLPLQNYSQPFGNEWIDLNQQYYKFKVADDGLVRIDYNKLLNSGFPVTTVDPRRLQLFFRGQELAITVTGQLDASFDPGDFILFYGTKNDGVPDTELYHNPDDQPHTYYNLFSDSSTYFLTTSNSVNGKRIANFTENNVDGLPAVPYHTYSEIRLSVSDYSPGQHYPIGQVSAESLLSEFDLGEGWTGPRIALGGSETLNFSGIKVNKSVSEKPKIEVNLAGRNNLQHVVEVRIGPSASNLRPLQTLNFNYYSPYSETIEFEFSDISDAGDLSVQLRVVGNGTGSSDFVSISSVKVEVPEFLDQNSLNSKTYRLPEDANDKSYVEISNVNSGLFLFDITDQSNLIRIGYNQSGSDVNAIVPGTSIAKTLYFSNEITDLVAPLKKVNFRNVTSTENQFVIVSHPLVRQPTTEYNDPVEAYATYRSSMQGGGYDTLVFNIEDLYDQFNYGNISPLAIRHLIEFLNQSNPPKYLFIIGKGLTANYNFHRSDFGTAVYKDLIPPSGYPGTDFLFSAYLDGSDPIPVVPTGRISVSSSNEVEAYLNKVLEMEAVEYDGLWRKDLIHLSGGRGQLEQNLFRGYVENFEKIAVDDFLGGQATTKSKKTNNSTELIDIASDVNDGKMLITFFGHSGSVGTDIDIGFVSNPGNNYNNKGRYVTIFVNGCNAGDMYFPGYGFGEDWIATADLGALAFVAHTNQGISSLLKRYTDEFYAIGLADSINISSGIGDIQNLAAKAYIDRYTATEFNLSQIHQMALQGDPAVKLFGAPLPDFEVNENNVFIETLDGTPVNAFSSALRLGIVVRNFGRTQTDSIDLFVQRKLSNGQIVNYDTIKYAPVKYADTLSYFITNLNIDAFGNNEFTIQVDPRNRASELNKTNNQAIFPYFFPIGGSSNLLPQNFAIVNQDSITLVAQSLDVKSGIRQFIFQIDTIDTYSSPAFESFEASSAVSSSWKKRLFQQVPKQDSTTFYWRTRLGDPKPDEIDEWIESSFTYIENSPEGWNMSHFPQFKTISNEELNANQTIQKWEFNQFTTNVSVKNYGPDSPEGNFETTDFKVNDINFIFPPDRLCTNNTINMVAFDSKTTGPYLGVRFSSIDILDRRTCGRVPQIINNFTNNEIVNNKYIELFLDAIKVDDYILLFSIGEVNYEAWPATTISKLEEMGIQASTISGLLNGDPFIALGQKGALPGTAQVVLPDGSSGTPNREQSLELMQSLISNIFSGTLNGASIGPSSQWQSANFNFSLPDTEDIAYASLFGIRQEGTEVLLDPQINSGIYDLSGIDANVYPYIRYQFFTEDATNRTPAQLKAWSASYSGVPEGIISTQNGEPLEAVSVQEGEEVTFQVLFTNVSAIDFEEEIQTRIELLNTDTRVSTIDTISVPALKAGEFTTINISLNTLGKSGTHNLSIFVNPRILPEVTYNNNLIEFANLITVVPDKTNPILEVTVDGRFILDGDIVSPSPEILVRMKDENKLILKTDTTGFDLFLSQICDDCVEQRLYFSSPIVNWTPATEKDDFTILIKPDNLANGMYNFRVNASDASGNQSGNRPFSINFEVVNESTITNFFPYPNPFSTSTRFVFTLTGSVIPDQIKIQIMTVSGRVVREITNDEIGPINIGNNISEYAWDGRDEYGDQLANGVYLYRVIVRSEGQDLEKRSTSADKAFKNGVGKMYLLR